MIERFKDHGIKENTNLFLQHIHLHKNTGTGIRQLEYSQIIKSLMYLKNWTRPDVAYAVSKLSKYTSNPNDDHWTALLRVVGYVSKIREYALKYRKYLHVLERYSDANWIAYSDESKSTSGYVFTLGGAAVSWKIFKQTCITRSTIESEFIALDKVGEEAEWFW